MNKFGFSKKMIKWAENECELFDIIECVIIAQL